MIIYIFFKFLGVMLSNSLLLYCEDKSCKGISLILKYTIENIPVPLQMDVFLRAEGWVKLLQVL